MKTMLINLYEFIKLDLPSAILFAATLGAYSLMLGLGFGFLLVEKGPELIATYWVLLLSFQVRILYAIWRQVKKWEKELDDL